MKNYKAIIMQASALNFAIASDGDIEDNSSKRHVKTQIVGRAMPTSNPSISSAEPAISSAEPEMPTAPINKYPTVKVAYLLEKLRFYRLQVERIEAQLNTLVLGRESTPPSGELFVSGLAASVRDSFEYIDHTDGESSEDGEKQ